MDLSGRTGGEGSVFAASRPIEGTEKDIKQRGHRHAEERAENTAQLGADQQRRHGDQRVDACDGARHPWADDVRLDRMPADRHQQGKQADERPFEDEGNDDGQAHPDWCADQRQELEEEGQNAEDDRVRDSDQGHGDASVGAHK